LYSQPYGYIGNETETNDKYGYPTPYGTYYKNQRMQIILTKNELLSAGLIPGNINSIGFNVMDLNNCSEMPNFTIKVGVSDKQNYDDENFVVGLTEVYFNSNFIPFNGWNDHIFTTPIFWDGTKNLIIDVCFDIIPGSYTENASVFITNKYVNRTLMSLSDNEPICDNNSLPPMLFQYVPNVRISGNLASCLPPIQLSASNITKNSAQISWQSQNGESEWIVEYGASGFEPGTGSGIVINTNQPLYNLTGLLSNTQYDFYVKAICSLTDESYFAGPYTFKTLCDEIDIPYFNGFEDETPYNELPDCWHFLMTGYSSSQIIDYSPISGNQCLSLYADYNQYNMIILPMFNATVQDLILSFVSYHSWGSNQIDVGIISDPYDINSFEYLYSIYLNPFSYTQHNLFFSNSSLPTGHIALKYVGELNSGNIYIDDINVNLLSGCPAPILNNANNITENSVDLSWIDSGLGLEWDIEYGEMNFVPGTGTLITNLSTTNYNLTGLLPQTYYDVYVRTHCSPTETSDWSNKITFRTNCSYFDIPFIENFDNSYNDPECWSFIEDDLSGHYISSGDAFSSPNSIVLYNNGVDNFIITPKLNANIADLRIRFFAKSNAEGFVFSVGTISDPENPTTFTSIQNFTTSTNYKAYQTLFNGYSGTDEYIAIRLESSLLYPDLRLDNIIIDYIPSCFEPTELTYTDATTNSCTLSWQDANVNSLSFDIEYGPYGFTPGTGTLIEDVSNPYTIYDLPSGSIFQYYVRAHCSTTEISNWSFAGVFITLCEIQDIPYYENFYYPILPICMYFNGFYPYSFRIENNIAISDPYSLGVIADYSPTMFSLPKFSTPVNKLKLKFYAYVDSWEPTNIEIGTCSDPSNLDSFETIAIEYINDLYQFHAISVDFNTYTGNNENIAVKIGNFSSYNIFYIDDISVLKIPEIAVIDPYNEIQPITVCKYTGMGTVLQNLPTTVRIKDDLDNEYLCNLNWTVPTYNPINEGDYPAYGTFNLPQGVVQSDPPMQLQVTTTVYVVVCSAVDDDINEELFTIYPNPNNGSFRFNANTIMKMEIIDITGAVIFAKTTKVGENYIHLENIAEGLYQVRFTDGNIVKTVKFIIQ